MRRAEVVATASSPENGPDALARALAQALAPATGGGIDALDVAAELLAALAAAGCQPDELVAWVRDGRSCEDAFRWVRLGISLPDAAKYLGVGVGPEQASRWQAMGATPNDAARWLALGLEPDEARRWKAAGGEPTNPDFVALIETAGRRRDGSLAVLLHTGDVADTLGWASLGVSATEAIDWSERGWSSASYRRWARGAGDA